MVAQETPLTGVHPVDWAVVGVLTVVALTWTFKYLLPLMRGRNGQPQVQAPIQTYESLINLVAARVAEVQQDEWRTQSAWRGQVGQLLNTMTKQMEQMDKDLRDIDKVLTEVRRRLEDRET